MIERGKVQTLSWSVYLDGLQQVPSAGSWSLLDRSGAVVLSKVVGSLGTNTVSLVALDTSGLDLDDRYLEEWVLTISGEVYTFRREAALVRRVLYSVITEDDLEKVHSGLSAYLPSKQTSWDDQIQEAFVQLQARLIGKGNRPNLIMGSWALRTVHLYWSLFLIAELLRVESSGRWGQLAESWGGRVKAEWDSLTFSYDDGDDGVVNEDEAAVPTLILSDLPSTWRGSDLPSTWRG